jgi:ATP-dependent Lon protease
MSDASFFLNDFSGTARLFPLPNLVMFPHVVQPLHVFESRFIELLEDALSGDQLIGMSLLLPGWEEEYEGRPPIDPTICLGRVMSHTRTDNGKYNILLAGLSRARVIRELPPTRSYRQAQVELVADQISSSGIAEQHVLRGDLVACFRQLIPQNPTAQQQLDELLGNEIALGTLTDLVTYSLPLELTFKQLLLAEPHADRRAHLLLEHLNSEAEVAAAGSRPFPPEFSSN